MCPIIKKELQQRILHLDFDPTRAQDCDEIINYCFSDCDGCAALYSEIARKVDPVAMSVWSRYLSAVAPMELWGIPIDYSLARLILHARERIRDFLIAKVNETAPIYQGLSFRRKAFLWWCRDNGIAWPLKISPHTGRRYQPLDDESMRQMELHHSFISLIRQVRKTIRSFGRRRILIDGRTRRHHFGTSVFRTITGRNAPRDFIFSGPKWMRWLIVPESPNHVLVYVDFKAQEIGIAAALSRDSVMRGLVETDDPHMTFAVLGNAVPAGSTKETHPLIRKKYKTVNLGVLYGQTEFGISDRLGISIDEARDLLNQHRELFGDYWEWSRRIVQTAYDRGRIITAGGWSCLVPRESKPRTWMNWLIQASGADIMRLVIIYLDQQNVRILAPVHDGFLLSCRRDEIDDLRVAVDLACSKAVSQVLGDFPLRWDITIHNDRFKDGDGKQLWDLLMEALKELYPE
jgi:hypothetical protein